LKLPDPNEGLLHEAGGACLGSTGPVHAAEKAGAEAIERAVIDTDEPGGASLDANAAPAATKGTASVELIGVAKKAAAAKPEALEPWAESEAWCGLEMLPPLPRKGSGEPGSPPREAPAVGMRRHDQPPRGSPSEGERRPQQAPQETPQAGVLAAQEGAPTVLKDATPGHFEERPSWDIEVEPGGRKILTLTRPFEAKEGDDAGHTGLHKNKVGRIKIASVQAAPQISKDRVPWGCTHHHDAPSKSPAVFVLRPMEGHTVGENKASRTRPPGNVSRRRHTRVTRNLAPRALATSGRGHRIKQIAPP